MPEKPELQGAVLHAPESAPHLQKNLKHRQHQSEE
jgi:hypothetical protein